MRAGQGPDPAGVGLVSFAVLGVSDAMLGVAWPAMRSSFHRSLGSLGILLLATAVGMVVTAVPTARVLARLGVAIALTTAAALAAVAAITYSVTPLWWSLVAAAFLLGCGGGVLDAGLNTVLAQAGRRRFLNLLHGTYGAGTVLGPLLMTAGLLVAGSWRVGYALLAVVEVLLAVAWFWSRGRWPSSTVRGGAMAASHANDPEAVVLGGVPGEPGFGPALPTGATDRRPSGHGAAVRGMTALGLAAFFFCAGAEMTAGQWAASFLRGPIGLSAGIAGVVVSGYWASFAAVRLLLAIPRSPPAAAQLAVLGCLFALAGSFLLWWRPTTGVTIAGFALIGVGLGPVFPSLVSLTPLRLGGHRAQHVIGWQMAAAGVGGTGLSALMGPVLQRAGLGALGITLIVIISGLCLTNVALEVRARRAVG